MSLDTRLRQITKELRRTAKELRSFARDESARTFVDHLPLGPVAARLGRQVAWVADELRAALDGPPQRYTPLVCIRVVVDRVTAYRWARTATVPVERWLAELADREAHRLAVQVQREELSHWLYELSQGRDSAPPLEDPDPRAAYRKAAELLLSPPPRRRPARP
jgi:hypothetical protein